MAAPLIPDDAGTIAHLWVNGGNLIDTKGRIWNEIGSVPRIAKANLGFASGIQAESIGPFSTSNYFRTPDATAAAWLSLPSTFWFTFIIAGDYENGGSFLLVHQDSGNGAGLMFGASSAYALFAGGGGAYLTTSYVPPNNTSFHVVSLAKTSGGSPFAKVDTTAIYTSGDAGLTAAMTSYSGVAYLGMHPDFGGRYPWPGRLVEMRLTSTTPTNALIDALHNSLITAEYGQIITNAQAIGAAAGYDTGYTAGYDAKTFNVSSVSIDDAQLIVNFDQNVGVGSPSLTNNANQLSAGSVVQFSPSGIRIPLSILIKLRQKFYGLFDLH